MLAKRRASPLGAPAMTLTALSSRIAYGGTMRAGEPPADNRPAVDVPLAGSSIVVRRDDPDGPERLAQYYAGLRARFGGEVAERIQRTQELMKSPAPLSDPDRAVLRRTLAPVLRDLAATGQTLPEIREEAHHDRGDDTVCAWIQRSGGGGEGIEVWLPASDADRLSRLAEQVQSWKNDELIDAGRRPWPACPDHDDCFALSPDSRAGIAVWLCPKTGRIIAEIGRLGRQ